MKLNNQVSWVHQFNILSVLYDGPGYFSLRNVRACFLCGVPPGSIFFFCTQIRGSLRVFWRTFSRQALRKTEAKCPFVHWSFYGKAESDQKDFGFLRIPRKMGLTPMSGTLQQAEYGEGPGKLVFFNIVVGVLVTALLCASQVIPLAEGFPTHSIQGHWLQKNRQENSISREAPGRTFIYSLEPWGGIRVNNAERPLFAMWDVSILPSRSGGNLLSNTAQMRIVAESKTGMKRGDIRPSIQFFRVRNLNWITTSWWMA